MLKICYKHHMSENLLEEMIRTQNPFLIARFEREEAELRANLKALEAENLAIEAKIQELLIQKQQLSAS